MVELDGARTLREARASYFEANGFGSDGGYGARWVRLKAGPIRFGFPNLPSRVRAVRLHDLHHLVTGYETDWKGEFEISAWEVAGSCRDYVAAWILNLGGIAGGLVTYPSAVFRAFVRGRHSQNLYRRGFSEDLLDLTLVEARRELGLDAPAPRAGLADCLVFGLWSGAAVGYALVSLALYAAPVAGAVWLGSRLLTG